MGCLWQKQVHMVHLMPTKDQPFDWSLLTLYWVW